MNPGRGALSAGVVGKAYAPAYPFVVLGALLAAAVYYGQGYLNHDTSYLLVATERWLNGATLYSDIMEINPPLIFYLTAPSIFASDALHISPTVAFVVAICALTGVSLAWTWNLLERAPLISSAVRDLVVLGCYVALIVIPSTTFGQREHIFAIFALPYFMTQAFAWSDTKVSRLEKFALGLFAAVGIALKPFFLIPALVLTALACWQERRLKPIVDPANLAIGTGCAAYVLFSIAFHPEYFAIIVPLAVQVYGAIGFGADVILRSSIVPVLLIIAVATADGAQTPVRGVLDRLTAILAGLLVAYMIQFKGWAYQLLPFESMAVIASIAAVALSSASLRSKPIQFLLLAWIPATLIGRAATETRYELLYADAFESRLERVTADWTERSLLHLSTNDQAAFPLVNKLRTRWAGRYPYQWVLAGAVARQAEAGCTRTPEACPELTAILDFARRTNVDDFVAQSPDVVLVDVRPAKTYFAGQEFDYVAFLNEDPRFPAIWQAYRKLDSTLEYDIWLRE